MRDHLDMIPIGWPVWAFCPSRFEGPRHGIVVGFPPDERDEAGALLVNVQVTFNPWTDLNVLVNMQTPAHVFLSTPVLLPATDGEVPYADDKVWAEIRPWEKQAVLRANRSIEKMNKAMRDQVKDEYQAASAGVAGTIGTDPDHHEIELVDGPMAGHAHVIRAFILKEDEQFTVDGEAGTHHYRLDPDLGPNKARHEGSTKIED